MVNRERSVGIVDYQAGNLKSVANAVASCDGACPVIIARPEQLAACDQIILPGVGAFPSAMARLRELGFVSALGREVQERGKPFLGICLGMQLLMDRSWELGETEGLGWISGEVLALPDEAGLRVPHIGWDDTHPAREDDCFRDIPAGEDFYYLHSYYVHCDCREDVVATFDYGVTGAAAVRRENVFAVQFHPEKSQRSGLRIIRNFIESSC